MNSVVAFEKLVSVVLHDLGIAKGTDVLLVILLGDVLLNSDWPLVVV
jgi:hypothetical protein